MRQLKKKRSYDSKCCNFSSLAANPTLHVCEVEPCASWREKLPTQTKNGHDRGVPFGGQARSKDDFGERPEIAAVFRGLGLVLLVVVILDLQRESKFRERSARSLHGWF
jgi:hypothetical protein